MPSLTCGSPPSLTRHTIAGKECQKAHWKAPSNPHKEICGTLCQTNAIMEEIIRIPSYDLTSEEANLIVAALQAYYGASVISDLVVQVHAALAEFHMESRSPQTSASNYYFLRSIFRVHPDWVKRSSRMATIQADAEIFCHSHETIRLNTRKPTPKVRGQLSIVIQFYQMNAATAAGRYNYALTLGEAFKPCQLAFHVGRSGQGEGRRVRDDGE